MAEKQRSDTSAAACKAWETRRQKYGPSGLSRKPERCEEAPEEIKEKAGAESGGKRYFCDYCGAGPFKESWQKATHVKGCKSARESRAKQH